MSDMYSCLNRRLPRRYSPNCLRSLIIGWRLPLWRHGTLTDLENQLVSIRYYQNIYQYKELHSVLYLFDRTWKYWIEKGWGVYAMGSIADKPSSIWHCDYQQSQASRRESFKIYLHHGWSWLLKGTNYCKLLRSRRTRKTQNNRGNTIGQRKDTYKRCVTYEHEGRNN